jgi:hypothetical protein
MNLKFVAKRGILLSVDMGKETDTISTPPGIYTTIMPRDVTHFGLED